MSSRGNVSSGALFTGLTEPQQQAVAHVDGALLVLAGPGSGKTTVVTRRVANLIAQGIPPWQILALTFTNKAAGEMRERILKLIPPPEELPGLRGLTVSTFHAFCARLLRRYAAEVPGYSGGGGLSPQFTIYDSADQKEAIKLALKEAQMDTKNWTPGSVAHAISGAKNILKDAATYGAEASDFYTRSIAKVYAAYEKILKKNNAVDFDDLLLVTAKLLRGNARLRQELQQRFQYILIDEYQDTNHAQFVIAHALAANHGNICVVGDPDQSIYGWRGADISNILEFEKQYPNATVIPLGQNFRSTSHIVQTAATLIENNRKRKSKRLHTDLGEGEKPSVVSCVDEHHEAQLIVSRFKEMNAGSPLPSGAGNPNAGNATIPWREMAVLYRINALSRVLEDAFRTANIPYVIARGTAFYERKEVKDALAYLRLVANPNDEVSLRRIINTPTRGIGGTTVDKVEIHAINNQLPLFDAIKHAAKSGDVAARTSAAMLKFVGMVESWREAASGSPQNEGLIQSAGKSPLAGLVERIIRESGLEAMHRKSKLEEDEDRLENLNELINAAAEFVPPASEDGLGAREAASGTELSTTNTGTILDSLNSFLESVTLVSDADAIDPAKGAVTLMTLHAAKGLEFECVAIAGLEEGLLPHSRSAASEDELEEERRLLFVGITRAKRRLMITHANRRTNRGLSERTIPSQFLRELPEGEVERMDLAGDGFGNDGDDLDDFGSGGGGWGKSSWDAAAHTRNRSGSIKEIAAGGNPRGGRNTSFSAKLPATSDLRQATRDHRQTSASSGVEFPIGCMVEHPKFGVGRVEAFTPRVSGSSVQVAFSSVGRKTLIVEFAKLQRVE